MSAPPDLRDTILAAWATNNRITVFLVENLPLELWPAAVPDVPRRTIRMIAGHMHNARCMWIKTLGRPHGIRVPASVDRHRVQPRELVEGLSRSSRGIASLLEPGVSTVDASRPRRRMRGGICRLTWGMSFPISSRTRVITGARSSWWRVNWGIGSPLPSQGDCGSGPSALRRRKASVC